MNGGFNKRPFSRVRCRVHDFFGQSLSTNDAGEESNCQGTLCDVYMISFACTLNCSNSIVDICVDVSQGDGII